MGDEKKLWEQFEKLAVDCVKDCYCKDGTEIAPTQPIKDNGYDALILNNIFYHHCQTNIKYRPRACQFTVQHNFDFL